MTFRKRKIQNQHNTKFFQTLNKHAQRAWKRLLRDISQSSMVKKSHIDINICYLITDFSVGTLIPCILCQEINQFFNLKDNESVKCVNKNCAQLLLNRWCDNCGNYTIPLQHAKINSKLKCLGCRKKVCPFNCIQECANKCSSKECLCLQCVKIVPFFDGYKCGFCDECGELLCGVCYYAFPTCKCCRSYTISFHHYFG